jgi:hypothetical protein
MGLQEIRNKESCKKRYESNREAVLASRKKYYYAHKGEVSAYQKEKFRKKRIVTYQKLGGRCAVCGKRHEMSQLRSFNFHEIHGNGHAESPYAVYKNSENFVILCSGTCHRHVHFAMKWFGMTWNEILVRVAEVKGRIN